MIAGGDVAVSGPLVDGRARRAGAAMTPAVVEAVAQTAFDEVGRILDAELKNPTGYYESRVTQNRVGTNAAVTDGGVVYGPWLEGVSSRNQATRFKGYAAFRRATRQTQAQVLVIAQPIVTQAVKAMNR